MDKDKDSEYLQFLEDAKSALSEDNIDQSPQDVEKIIQENKSSTYKRLEKERVQRMRENREYILEQKRFEREREKFRQEQIEFEEKKKLFEEARDYLPDPDKMIQHTEELRILHETVLEEEARIKLREDQEYILERERITVERKEHQQQLAALQENINKLEKQKEDIEDFIYADVDPDKVLRHTEELHKLQESVNHIGVEDVPLNAFKMLNREERVKVIDMYKELLKELDDQVKDMTVEQAHQVIQDAINDHNIKAQQLYGEYMDDSNPYHTKGIKEFISKDEEFDYIAFKKRMTAYHKHINELRYYEDLERPQEDTLSETVFNSNYVNGVPQGDFQAQLERIQNAREKELEDNAHQSIDETNISPAEIPISHWPSSTIYGNLTANGGMYDDGTGSKPLTSFRWR